MNAQQKTEVADENTACLTELLVAAGMELARRGIRAERIDNQLEEGSDAGAAATCYLTVDGTAVYMATVTITSGLEAARTRQGTWMVTGLRVVGLADLAEAVELDRALRSGKRPEQAS